MENKKPYYYCIVPCCTNTTKATPEKSFFSVPFERNKRRRWFVACKRKDFLSTKTRCSICEDHFNLEQDLENYWQWKLSSIRPMFKTGVVPHLFDCQRSVCLQPKGRLTSSQRERKQMVKTILESSTNPENVEELEVSNGNVSSPQHHSPNITGIDLPKRGRKPTSVHHRSVSVQCNATMKNQATSPISCTSVIQSGKVVNVKLHVSDVFTSSSEDDAEAAAISDQAWEPESCDEVSECEETIEVQLMALRTTRYYNDKKPSFYLGVPEDSKFIVDMLAKKLNYSGDVLSSRDVVELILRKIKSNLPFEFLGDLYGVTSRYAAKLFSNYVETMADNLKQLVRWLPPESVQTHLPISFWARFSDVYAFLDTFEIQIEKPQDPVEQAESYSEYKKCNTLKYLIAVSPDGVIMFISKGVLGRCSDTMLTDHSKLLGELPRNVSIMADRGFKGLGYKLSIKNNNLVVPPSVVKDKILSKEETIRGKQIASLRIHVERVIGRIRKFRMVAPHATIHRDTVRHMDSVLFCAAGLINCRNKITKL